MMSRDSAQSSTIAQENDLSCTDATETVALSEHLGIDSIREPASRQRGMRTLEEMANSVDSERAIEFRNMLRARGLKIPDKPIEVPRHLQGARPVGEWPNRPLQPELKEHSDVMIYQASFGGRSVIRRGIEPSRVVKKSRPAYTLKEAAALRLVKQHTSIPVPTVYKVEVFERSYDRGPYGLIEMEFMPGQLLQDVWGDFDLTSKQDISRQLSQFVEQLRSIVKPASLSQSFYCAADGTSVFDVLLPENRSECSSDFEFRNSIRKTFEERRGQAFAHLLPKMIPEAIESVFTHNDLAPRNILVDGSRVTAILDWEMAGWLPDYWEVWGPHTQVGSVDRLLKFISSMRPGMLMDMAYHDDWQNCVQQSVPNNWHALSAFAFIRQFVR